MPVLVVPAAALTEPGALARPSLPRTRHDAGRGQAAVGTFEGSGEVPARCRSPPPSCAVAGRRAHAVGFARIGLGFELREAALRRVPAPSNLALTLASQAARPRCTSRILLAVLATREVACELRPHALSFRPGTSRGTPGSPCAPAFAPPEAGRAGGRSGGTACASLTRGMTAPRRWAPGRRPWEPAVTYPRAICSDDDPRSKVCPLLEMSHGCPLRVVQRRRERSARRLFHVRAGGRPVLKCGALTTPTVRVDRNPISGRARSSRHRRAAFVISADRLKPVPAPSTRSSILP